MRRWAGILLAATLLVGTSACGGDDDDGDQGTDGIEIGTEEGNLKPEDMRATPAEVADGFRELNRYVDEVVAKLGTDDAATAELQERLLTIWESILGTVKANDADAYSELNDAFALLMTVRETADKANAQEAADTVEETSAAYLDEFAGSGASTGDSPSPSAGSSSSDEPADVESDVESDADPPISY